MAEHESVRREEVSGTVVERLPSALFRVELDGHGQVLVHLSGGMQRNFIRILSGDRVLVELARHDVTRGRIVRRVTEAGH